MQRSGLQTLFAMVAISLLAGCAGSGGKKDEDAGSQGRTTGTVVEDQAIEMKAVRRLYNEEDLYDQTHVNVTSYNTIVLVTGEAPTQELRNRVIQTVRGIEKVRKVYDEITIAAPSALTARTSDTLLTAKVKAQLFGSKELDATRVKVVTEKGVVYLLGLITRRQAESATEIARRVSGVQRVVKLFEYSD